MDDRTGELMNELTYLTGTPLSFSYSQPVNQVSTDYELSLSHTPSLEENRKEGGEANFWLECSLFHSAGRRDKEVTLGTLGIEGEGRVREGPHSHRAGRLWPQGNSGRVWGWAWEQSS